MILTNEFSDLSQGEKELIDGGGLGGAAIGFTLGIGYGLCVGAVKAGVTGDNSHIWKSTLKNAFKGTIKGAFLPY